MIKNNVLPSAEKKSFPFRGCLYLFFGLRIIRTENIEVHRCNWMAN